MSLIVWSGTRNCSWRGGKDQMRHSTNNFRQHSWQHTSKPGLADTLPSTSWKYNQSSSTPHNQSHLSWMFWHTGRRPETSPARTHAHTHKQTQKYNQKTVCIRYSFPNYETKISTIKQKCTQCLRSTSSSASHFRVRNGRFLLMISPAKNVVSVGYSCKIKQ